MNDNELGFSPIRQYAHDDVGSFSSMCEEALRLQSHHQLIVITYVCESKGASHPVIPGQKISVGLVTVPYHLYTTPYRIRNYHMGLDARKPVFGGLRKT